MKLLSSFIKVKFKPLQSPIAILDIGLISFSYTLVNES